MGKQKDTEAKQLSPEQEAAALNLTHNIEKETEPFRYNEMLAQYEELTGQPHYHVKNVEAAQSPSHDTYPIRYDADGVGHRVDEETGETTDGSTDTDKSAKKSKAVKETTVAETKDGQY